MSVLDRLVDFCLHNKLVVVLATSAIICWGYLVAPFDWHGEEPLLDPVAVDAIPDIGENQQIVFTRWMGRSPQDVEDQITYPLTTALLGIPHVETIRSFSMFGFSSIYVIFDEEAEFYWSRSRVLEKLNSLPSDTLPDGVQPALGPDATALGQVFWYTLEGRDPDGEPVGGWDLQELRSIQDWNVRYALMGVEGISEVASIGGFVKEYQVDVDPDAMRAHGVTLQQVMDAVRMSNAEIGAKTLEINKAEYLVRGLGFVESVEDLERTVVAVGADSVPIRVADVARVELGPALRRGALDKSGAEAVGGVAVVRYGFNPMAAIKNLKEKIDEIAPGLDRKAVIVDEGVPRERIAAWARERGFVAFREGRMDQEAWLDWLRSNDPDGWPDWITTSQVTVVPFYDRTGLIEETLGTLNTALVEEILVTLIVVLLLMRHLRSSLLIGGLLPAAVLMCFIAMRSFGVDANIVALSGIAIAIGTMVDMGIVVCENIFKHLGARRDDEPLTRVVFRATREVGGAVLTAVATTVVSFLPVFAMVAAEGKLFRPLAFTKTFALIASILVALFVIPPLAALLFGRGPRRAWVWRVLDALGLAGALLGHALLPWWMAVGLDVLIVGGILRRYLPDAWSRRLATAGHVFAALLVAFVLARHWAPLGYERPFANLSFVILAIGSLLGLVFGFQAVYRPMLAFCLRFKSVPILAFVLTMVAGFYVWVGLAWLAGPLTEAEPAYALDEERIERLIGSEVLERAGDALVWAPGTFAQEEKDLAAMLEGSGVDRSAVFLADWRSDREYARLRFAKWGGPDHVGRASMVTRLKWTLARDWQGRGSEFMPSLDEGSFLLMPTTMPHASIGEAMDVMRKQDMAIRSIPEVEHVVGKLGRVESPLDPAPVSMFETLITYKGEFITDADGTPSRFRYDDASGGFVRDERGALIPDEGGRAFRQWRDHIRSPQDIWDAILDAAQIPGTTSAPKLQPIETRLVMLQSGMRAPMGVKLRGPSLEALERAALRAEAALKSVPSIRPATVIADRVVGKPYLEIDPDRERIARHGLHPAAVNRVIEAAIGGMAMTTTVEGRERYPVRVRYARELRDSPQAIGEVLVPAPDGSQIPLAQLADIRYVRGPQVIKSEDTFPTAYVVFDKKPGYAEVDVATDAREKLDGMDLGTGITYRLAGSFENQQRAARTMAVMLPLAILIIFLILYLLFRSVLTTLIVGSGVALAFAGGFILLWCYAQPWFLGMSAFGVDFRELFQIREFNLSVAVWVGFLALFGIATDNGVILATYLRQRFDRDRPVDVAGIRAATLEGSMRRIRPCLMTSATTILALLPVLTSTGRGADVMVPMAIPSFGGMVVVLLAVFVVPALYCWVEEVKFRWRPPEPSLGDSDPTAESESENPERKEGTDGLPTDQA